MEYGSVEWRIAQRCHNYDKKGRLIVYLPPSLRGALRVLGIYFTGNTQ